MSEYYLLCTLNVSFGKVIDSSRGKDTEVDSKQDTFVWNCESEFYTIIQLPDTL